MIRSPLGSPVADVLDDVLGGHVLHPIAGGDICRAFRVVTGEEMYFAKTPRFPDPYLLPVEADGLRRIGAAVPGLVPEVVHADEDWLVLEWVEQTSAGPAAAEMLGRMLAQLHATPAGDFGDGPAQGRIGRLDMPVGTFDSWAPMYAELRLRPLVDEALPNCTALADALLGEPEWAGPREPASLIHGDLWSGNILWSEQPRVIDPACHVGHRETDLAMLALFGTVHLDHLLAAYQEVFPLAPGWQARVGLHQLWPLLVHARMFGGGYAARAEAVAADYLG
ncbi:MAG: fructosamine kinase family protein [Actinobacteria bacterium]|nr:fructosamine kinase family protein [Actinomycetota bacterium]MCB8997093.1 fructosamine kinase family protein [Actinomycetota bacterium]MCB9424822.1 fructosamine kinase family protein [Actinomycetota bacterium]HRY09428.1 fructosamine kinase family protein [Candidatus Nanopelagicales bacterium]